MELNTNKKYVRIKGQLITPLIVFRRVNGNANETISVDKLDPTQNNFIHLRKNILKINDMIDFQ